MPLGRDQDAPHPAGGNAGFRCDLPAEGLQRSGTDRDQLGGTCWAGAWAFVLHGPFSRCWVG